MPKATSTDQQKCSVCGRDLEMGYGLAGGGMGPYLYCEEHGIIEKWGDPELEEPPKDSE